MGTRLRRETQPYLLGLRPKPLVLALALSVEAQDALFSNAVTPPPLPCKDGMMEWQPPSLDTPFGYAGSAALVEKSGVINFPFPAAVAPGLCDIDPLNATVSSLIWCTKILRAAGLGRPPIDISHSLLSTDGSPTYFLKGIVSREALGRLGSTLDRPIERYGVQTLLRKTYNRIHGLRLSTAQHAVSSADGRGFRFVAEVPHVTVETVPPGLGVSSTVPLEPGDLIIDSSNSGSSATLAMSLTGVAAIAKLAGCGC